MIIFDIFDMLFGDLYITWTRYVNAGLLSSVYLLILFTIGFFALVYLVSKKRTTNTRIMIFVTLIPAYYFIIVQQFNTGGEINYLLDKGYTLAERLEKFKNDTGNYPVELYPVLNDDLANDSLFLDHCRYKLYDHNESNKKYRTDFKEDYYELYIRIPSSTKVYYYNTRRKKFYHND